MDTKELLYATGETVEYGKQYIEQQIEYIRLETAKRVAMTTSGLITTAVIALFGFMILIFFSVALGFYLGEVLDSNSLAFLIVGLIYLVATLIIVFFKRTLITNPILSSVIKNILH